MNNIKEKYYLEKTELADLDDFDDLQTLEEEPILELDEICIENAEKVFSRTGQKQPKEIITCVTPPRIDELFRSFLVMNNMTRTMQAFQIEWWAFLTKYSDFRVEIHEKTLTDPLASPELVDMVQTNQNLLVQLSKFQDSTKKYKKSLKECRHQNSKMREERDYFKIHHKRTLEENERLFRELNKLKTVSSSYQPVIKKLTDKYKTAMRQKMLNQLQRDRAIGECKGLQSTIDSLKNLGMAEDSKEFFPEDSKEVMQVLEVQQHSKESTIFPPNGMRRQRHDNTSHAIKSNYKSVINLSGHSELISQITSHPFLPYFVSGSEDKSFKVWNSPSGHLVCERRCPELGWVASLSFDKYDGTKLAVGGENGFLQIWPFSIESKDELPDDGDKQNGKTTQQEFLTLVSGVTPLKIKCHAFAILSLDWSPTELKFMTGCIDGSIKIWNYDQISQAGKLCKPETVLRTEKSAINSACYLPNGNAILVGLSSGGIRIYDVRRRVRLQYWDAHHAPIRCIRPDVSGKYVSSCDQNGIVHVWDLKRLESCLWSRLKEPRQVQEMTTHPRSPVNSFELRETVPSTDNLKTAQVSYYISV
ncbi:Sperm-associated antigen 16 protein [Cichlidogyrus casuarinus]|uniref:Sperm-associated antigen 16 protein n=1 Tax=Cichlidogyrus casuarinus TaxID=1844966 RepID=A0ABD2QCH4_9PLAT